MYLWSQSFAPYIEWQHHLTRILLWLNLQTGHAFSNWWRLAVLHSIAWDQHAHIWDSSHRATGEALCWGVMGESKPDESPKMSSSSQSSSVRDLILGLLSNIRQRLVSRETWKTSRDYRLEWASCSMERAPWIEKVLTQSVHHILLYSFKLP